MIENVKRSSAAAILTVQKQRNLSDEISATITLAVGESQPRVDWRAPPARNPATAGLSVLTDAEAHQYGAMVGEAYCDFSRISGATLMHVTEKRCGEGMREAGAAEVQYAGGAAIAVFTRDGSAKQ